MARHKILNAFAVPAAGAFTSDPVTIGEAGDLTAVFDFDYGSGGTSLDVWLQTSFDGGTNWYDLIHPAQFTTADNVEIYSVSSSGDLATAPAEGSKALAASTVQSGMIGDMVRVAGTVVGTYAASTITVIVESRQDSGGGGPVTMADGASVTLGAKADAAAGSGTVSLIALLKWVASAVKAEDAAVASGDKGALVLTKRTDVAATSADTDGDAATLNTDALGRLYTIPLVPLEGTALASAVRPATATSADIVNPGYRGLFLFLNVTAASGTGGLQVTIQAKDPVSGGYVQTNTAPTAVISTAGSPLGYVLYAGAAGSGAMAQLTGQPLAATFRVRVIHGDASSYTYSVGYCLLP